MPLPHFSSVNVGKPIMKATIYSTHVERLNKAILGIVYGIGFTTFKCFMSIHLTKVQTAVPYQLS
jgi:hypothetical protein